MQQIESTQWLSLSPAAVWMGVHSSTLRRWADRGDIPVMRTPGGHRRFSLADLRRYSTEERRSPAPQGIEFAWAGKALTRVRERLSQSNEAHWITAHSEQERSEYRQLGRRLMGVAMHFIADKTPSEALLEEAAVIGRTQAMLAIEHDVSLTETIRASLLFRDALLDVAFQQPEHAHLNLGASTRLLRGINTLLNTVQLEIGKTYENAYRRAAR